MLDLLKKPYFYFYIYVITFVIFSLLYFFNINDFYFSSYKYSEEYAEVVKEYDVMLTNSIIEDLKSYPAIGFDRITLFNLYNYDFLSQFNIPFFPLRNASIKIEKEEIYDNRFSAVLYYSDDFMEWINEEVVYSDIMAKYDAVVYNKKINIINLELVPLFQDVDASGFRINLQCREDVIMSNLEKNLQSRIKHINFYNSYEYSHLMQYEHFNRYKDTDSRIVEPYLIVRPMNLHAFFDSLYLSATVITSTIFGEVYPLTNLTKALVSAEALIGILLIGAFLNSLRFNNK